MTEHGGTYVIQVTNNFVLKNRNFLVVKRAVHQLGEILRVYLSKEIRYV
jgi:hypothetical protein